MDTTTLIATAQAMVAPGKGVLAADESTGTIGKRFASIGVESTEENRRAYRELLLTCSALPDTVGGVILYDETLRQSTADGTPFTELLKSRGVIPGIKVDTGAKALAACPDETVTEGLDGLRERLAEYRDLGAGFAKWRAVIDIGGGRPTATAIDANAHALARYAALCQEAGIVPIVEPEVMMAGDHTLDVCFEVTRAAQRAVFAALATHRVFLPGMVLKPNMVVSGASCPDQASAQAVAEATRRCLAETVPSAVPGVAFLSGGQTPEQSTVNLNAINALGPAPWRLTYSFGRGLQDPALKAWGGKPANVEAAQLALAHRLELTAAASSGTYDPEMENAAN